jgi:hypothetical protein
MTASRREPEERPARPARRVWSRPTATKVGRVRDLVRGEGKLSGGADGDAGNTRKTKGLG